MSYTTRKPTGLAPWPILLIAGVEKAGKTYAAVEAANSDLVGETYWLTVGENHPDEYGQLADFNIIEHGGTYRKVLGAIEWATQQPVIDGKPNLLCIDSASRIWALLCDDAQLAAEERAKRNHEKYGKPIPDEIKPTMDLWNIAKQRWTHIMNALRAHAGPVVLTARLDQVTVMEGERPTKDKQWKIQSEKSLPFDVDAIVELRSFGDAWMTGVRSLRFKPRPNEYTQLKDFTVESVWRGMGMGEGPVGERAHGGYQTTSEEAEGAERAAVNALLAEIKQLAEATGTPLKAIADRWESDYDAPIQTTTDVGSLELLRDDLRAKAGS